MYVWKIDHQMSTARTWMLYVIYSVLFMITIDTVLLWYMFSSIFHRKVPFLAMLAMYQHLFIYFRLAINMVTILQ